MPMGILIASFDFSTAAADEFHDWYDLEHIPERKAVAGFSACERWIGADQPSYSVATYDLDELAVLRSDAYKAIAYENVSVWSKRIISKCRRLLRFEGVQINPASGNARAPAGAGGLLINAVNVAPEHEKDFNAWYDEEHLPALAKVPGTLLARRYRAEGATGGTHQYVAVYHLASPDVPRTDAWKKAIDTPWSARVRPHFRDHVRVLARRYERAM